MTQEYTSVNPTELLETAEGFFFTKEYTDNTKTSFNYGIYYFDNFANPIHQPVLGRTVLNNPGSPLEFNKILHFGAFETDGNGINSKIYLIFTSDSSTKLVQKDILVSGNAEDVQEIATTRVNVLGGCFYGFYDQILGKYYIKPTDLTDNNYTTTAPKTVNGGTGTGIVLAGTIGVHKLRQDKFIMYSYAEGASANLYDSYYGFYNGRMTVLSEGSFVGGDMVPLTFGNLENFIFVAKGALVWMRTVYPNDYAEELNVFENLVAGTPDFLQAQADFKAALEVAFNEEKAFILTTNSLIIYEISKVAGVYATNRISEILMASSLSSKINGSAELSLKMSISCKCTQTKISTLVCFSQTLKCVSQVAPVTTDCTVPYTDDVPVSSS